MVGQPGTVRLPRRHHRASRPRIELVLHLQKSAVRDEGPLPPTFACLQVASGMVRRSLFFWAAQRAFNITFKLTIHHYSLGNSRYARREARALFPPSSARDLVSSLSKAKIEKRKRSPARNILIEINIHHLFFLSTQISLLEPYSYEYL